MDKICIENLTVRYSDGAESLKNITLSIPEKTITVIFGPAGGGIHSVDEWVDLGSLARFEAILLNVTRSFCG